MATGFEDLEAALKRLVDHADEASKAAAQAAGAVIEKGVKLELSRSSHPKGTPTPSMPGDPPSLVSGRLRQSVRQTSLDRVGDSGWQATVGGTVVYSRIHELSGWAGRDHKSFLPMRPYVAPAELKWALKARDAAIASFRNACGLY